jgi:O-succinylbenzoate synthase
MQLERIVLRKMKIQFKNPFKVSFTTMREKHFIFVEAHAQGHVGYADCSAFQAPFYNEETVQTAWHIICDFLAPMLFAKGEISRPEDLYDLFSPVRRNKMAKAALDCAVWDLYAKLQGVPLAQALGGTRRQVEAGVSIGIQESPQALLEVVKQHRAEGYRRVKIKIKPGADLAYLEAIRNYDSDLMLMADANSAYTLDDLDHLKEMDRFNLLMIEQPLAHDDIVDHAKLQKIMNTPICLDESIHSVEDARKAIELGSTRVINIKVARVGGLTSARKIHDLCQAHDIPVWCGGMLDTGIARAHNLAVASLPNYRLPHDIPSSTRYWHKDLITPIMEINPDSMVDIPQRPGIGFEPIPQMVDERTYEKRELTA